MAIDKNAETQRPEIGSRVSVDVLPIYQGNLVSATYKNPKHLAANAQNPLEGILIGYKPVYAYDGEIYGERGIIKLKKPVYTRLHGSIVRVREIAMFPNRLTIIAQ